MEAVMNKMGFGHSDGVSGWTRGGIWVDYFTRGSEQQTTRNMGTVHLVQPSMGCN